MITREQVALTMAHALFSGCLITLFVILVAVGLVMAWLAPGWSPLEVLR